MTEAAPERLYARVHGRVQGVGFRATTISVARGLGLSGWVRNLVDGDVELEAEGPREKLDKLLEFLAVGPRGARVVNVVPTWLPRRPDLTPLPTPFGMR
jgi:acylphosphatase